MLEGDKLSKESEDMDSDDESCLESGENGGVLISDASMLHVLALEEEDGLLCSGSECGICCKQSLVLAGGKVTEFPQIGNKIFF